jgi:hypothetical protein
LQTGCHPTYTGEFVSLIRALHPIVCADWDYYSFQILKFFKQHCN